MGMPSGRWHASPNGFAGLPVGFVDGFNSLAETWGPIVERDLAQVTQMLAALLAITESRSMTGTQEGATTERAKPPKGFETRAGIASKPRPWE
jgi:hypothetical protein